MKSAEYEQKIPFGHDELSERRIGYVKIVLANKVNSQQEGKGSQPTRSSQEKEEIAKVIDLAQRRKIKRVKHMPREIFSAIRKKFEKPEKLV